MLRIIAAFIAVCLLCAQTSMLPGFPPGTFQNRAALDAASGGGPPANALLSETGVCILAQTGSCIMVQ